MSHPSPLVTCIPYNLFLEQGGWPPRNVLNIAYCMFSHVLLENEHAGYRLNSDYVNHADDAFGKKKWSPSSMRHHALCRSPRFRRPLRGLVLGAMCPNS